MHGGHDPETPFDHRRTAEILQELRKLAERAGHRDLAYFIGMAQLEANKIAIRAIGGSIE